jgi:AcrR family transcriptional regulator
MAKLLNAMNAVQHRRLPPQQRREQIISVAKEMFAEQGVINVTMRALGKRCGITQASIYQHFADKDAVLAAICDNFFIQMLEQFRIASAAEQDPLQRLLAVMRAYLDFGLAHPEEYRLTFMNPVPHMHPPVEDGAPPMAGAMSFNFLQGMVAELMASGQISSGKPDAVAEAIWACGHGLVALLLTQKQFIHSEMDDLFNAHLGIILHGVLSNETRLAHASPSVQNTENQS